MAPTPVAVTGTYTNANSLFSGSLPASGGVDAAYAGPWAIVEQGLDIEYIRHPYGYSPTLTSTWNQFTLSDAHSYYIQPLNSTAVTYKVTAYVKKYKDYNTYSTSAYTRNQKFTIIPIEEDVHGYTYNDLSAGPDLCMGPQGQIVTEQSYYRRTPWDNDSDVEYEYTTSDGGFSRAFVTSGIALNSLGYMGHTQENMYAFSQPNDPGVIKQWTMHSTGPSYSIPQGYNTNKETDNLVKNFVDLVGQHLSAQWGGFFATYPTLEPNQWSGELLPIREIKIPEYNKTYHDWT